MKSYEALKGRKDYQAWITDETGNIACPNGESKNDFKRRVLKGYENIIKGIAATDCGLAQCQEAQCQEAHYREARCKSNDASIFVVTHGGVIAVIMEHLFPNTFNFYEWQPKPGNGYTINIKENTNVQKKEYHHDFSFIGCGNGYDGNINGLQEPQ
jgi:alpha-ribazole phosphatase